MPNLIFKPDKEYTLHMERGRFMIPDTLAEALDSDDYRVREPARMYLKPLVYEAGKDLIQANKIRGYHFRGNMGHKVYKSELQVDLYPFGTTSNEIVPAQDQGVALLLQNQVAYVVEMWFEAPKIEALLTSNKELSEADGFVENPPQSGDDIVEI